MDPRRPRIPAIESLRRSAKAAFGVGAVLLVAACGSGERKTAYVAPPPVQGTYKVGKPYDIDGITYRPMVDESYDETGIASWYGPKFHGKRTANGEFFDMNAVSAAHQTLPMPSMVRVTNLDNGRQIEVRVNDRGPFVRGRIIDMSRRGAQLLGFRYKGTARVRVRVLPEESRRVAALARTTPPPTTMQSAADGVVFEPLPQSTGPVETASLPAPGQGSATAKDTTIERVYIQAGAFLNPENANKLKARLAPLGRAVIAPRGQGPLLYRVLLGPYADVARARSLLGAVSARSRSTAKIVSN